MHHSYQVMPPLSSAEYAALKADIQANGVQIPIDVDEEDNTLDGFHRRQICAELGIECPKRMLEGLTNTQKLVHALRMNFRRRQLTQQQKREIARTLRAEGWTQDHIAQTLGTGQATISRWIYKFIQMDQLTQPEIIEGSDGKHYPSSKEPRRTAQPIDGENTDERVSTSLTPSGDSINDRIGARLAEGMQQDAVHTLDIEPERAPSTGAGAAPKTTGVPEAAFRSNGVTTPSKSETPPSPMRSLPPAWVDGAGEQSWVSGLEALLPPVQALQVQNDILRLSAHWHPEARTWCLDIIRCLKEVFTTWEEMIAHEIGGAASTNSQGDDDGTAPDIPAPLSNAFHANLSEGVPATETDRVTRPRGRRSGRTAGAARPTASVAKRSMKDHLASEISRTDGKGSIIDTPMPSNNEDATERLPEQTLFDF
jgi:Homeodomain-like domain/ParB-like nuclease domain